MQVPISKRYRLWLACVLFIAVGSATAQAPGDADILEAKAAFDRGDAKALAAVEPRTRSHVLAPYVTYWQFELQLDSADPDAIHAFLAANAGAPYADRLRADWLKALARRGDWTRFATEYSPSAADDTDLTCANAQYRRQRDGEAALAPVQPLWMTGQSTSDLCEPLFNALIASKSITTADRIARLRLAAEAGNVRLARALGDALPGVARAPAASMAKLEHDPERALAAGHFRLDETGGQVLALYALERAARADAATARGPWVKLRARLPAAARAYGNGRIAFHAARQLNPDADAWYREADPDLLNPEQRAWRVRAALRAGDWPGVLAAIAALPPATADETTWRYWKARALAATGNAADAQPIYMKLADEFNFYGILASEALGRRLNPVSAPVETSTVWMVDFGARPDVQRAVKLAALDMRPESLREWQVVVRNMDDEQLLRASEFARRAGLFDRSINTAERTVARHDFNLRYPTPFAAEFTSAAQANGIDITLLYGIARQESRFVPDIVSSAGAMGLMQLMPPTARWVSRQLNRNDFRVEQITQVDTNSQFGAFYLKYWLDRLDSRPALAAAAYNAGPKRAQAWRPATAPMEGAIWVETIPFNETRDYVKKVLANEMFYSRTLGTTFVTLTERLGVIQPRAGSADVARND
jgi:soluble lytic murein transglycosylase